MKTFEEKKDLWLKREEFQDPYARNDDDYDDDDHSIYYGNKYLTVSVVNYNPSREWREKHAYTDYYEERP